MDGKGTYSEKLACGGTLEVTAHGFRIHYYFPGPDLRHNGTFVDVPGEHIQDYIDAFVANWKKYGKLTDSIPKGGEFQKEGDMGMSIRIGKYYNGVYLKTYHMPIRSVEELREVIATYRYAQKRATQVQAMLRHL